MKPNSITVFTKDLPALEGGGKYIRMMNWLAHLSTQYEIVYCVYFYSSHTSAVVRDRWPENIVFIPIRLMTTFRLFSFFRRFILGIIIPYTYSFFWYQKINKNDRVTIHDLLMKSDAILFFRLYLFPLLIKFKNLNPGIENIAIDMDDAETDTFKQIGAQEWKRGEFKKWMITRLDWYYMNYYEKHIPRQVNTIYYSHSQDVLKYQSVYPDKNIVQFANKVPLVPENVPTSIKIENNLLFVGSLNYYPNIDAVHYLITEIWPLILDKKKDAKLIIAGSKPDRNLKNLISRTKSASLVENPHYIKEVFDKASILIVPLRMAGGTRIKVLQAFSYGVPVVSTSIGVSGIDVIHNVTGMIGNSSTDIVAACITLLNQSIKRNTMIKEAYSYYLKNHTFII